MPRHLILIPTEPERRLLAPRLAAIRPADAAVELCGFGIVAAAARTAQLLAALRPEKVILVGIAGRLDDRLAIGTATLFDSVACHGIGVGSGPAFIPAATLGWRQWPGDSDDADSGVGDVRFRKTIYPEAGAEEMEGFAVALACRRFRIPCTIVRGISNTAGDRDKAHWRISESVEATAALDTDIVVEATVHSDNAPDTQTTIDTAIDAAVNAEQVGMENDLQAIVVDKGYRSTKVVALAADLGVRAYIPERASPNNRRWTHKARAKQRAVYNARRPTQSERCRQVSRLRSELTERSFAYVCDMGRDEPRCAVS